jgi:hypothetical protein
VTWLALAPLVGAIGMPALAEVLVWWPLLFMVLAAGVWVAMIAYQLTMASVWGCLAIVILGPALPVAYRLATSHWPALWPANDAALNFAFVTLGAAFLLFVLQMGLLVTHSNKVIQEGLERHGYRLVIAASQALVAVVMLTWFAIASP